MLICALGDLLLDVIVLTDGTVESDSEGSARTSRAGGQSANVAAWSVELGAEGRFVGKRAADAAGGIVAAELAGRGVDVVGPVADGRNGIVVSLVDGDGRRTMLTDRGVAPELRAEELEMAWFRGCDVLHLSGYSLFRNPIAEAAAKAAGAVQTLGGRLSVDLSSATGIEAVRDAFLQRLELLQPDVVFGNESELAALGADPPARSVVVKRGAAGFTVDGREVLAAPPRSSTRPEPRRSGGRVPRRRACSRPRRRRGAWQARSDAVIRLSSRGGDPEPQARRRPRDDPRRTGFRPEKALRSHSRASDEYARPGRCPRPSASSTARCASGSGKPSSSASRSTRAR